MGLRTYLPTLRLVANVVCTYIGEHREKINEFVGEENVAAVDAALAACSVLVGILDGIIVHPT